MYHVRRTDGEERSMYADSLAGLEAATNEAIFRTKHTGADHEVYDDVQEKVVNTINCDRRQMEAYLRVGADEPPAKRIISWEWTIIAVLCILVGMRIMGVR